MPAEVDLIGGGGDGRRAAPTRSSPAANNETRNENIVGTFVDRTVAPPVTLRMSSEFASNAAAATGASATGAAFLQPTRRPRWWRRRCSTPGRAGAGSGGDTATLTRSRITTRTARAGRAAGGRVDRQPGDGDGPTHPARPPRA